MAKEPHHNSLVATIGEFAVYANITSDSSYYDDYVYVHSDLNPSIHFTGWFKTSRSHEAITYSLLQGLFFPFHRFFVWSYTQVLKNDCGYTGVAPYWDWTLGTL